MYYMARQSFLLNIRFPHVIIFAYMMSFEYTKSNLDRMSSSLIVFLVP